MKQSLATGVWHILQGKPIPEGSLRDRVVSVLRGQKDYLSPIEKAAVNAAVEDYPEKLTPKLEKYAEKYRKSPNQSGTIKPKFIIIHDSYGSFAGTVSWILNPTSDVSYHYVIDPKDGTRVQHVFDTKKAWQAGRSYWKGYSGLNSHSIGIAFSGNTHKRTPADYEIDSCARKCVYLMVKFGIKKDAILTHQMIAPKRKNDTAPTTYERVLERIDELLTKTS